MKVGWLRFGRGRTAATVTAPDKAVAAPPTWLLGAAIVASTAALLGTSETPDPSTSPSMPIQNTTTTFASKVVDGGFVELTSDQPAATVYVTVHADDLAADGLPTTDNASTQIDGTLTATNLDEGATAPAVEVKLSAAGVAIGSHELALDHTNQSLAIVFTGDCDNPKASGSCAAHFAVTLLRQDQGESGGVIRFDWTFTAQSLVRSMSVKGGDLGPFEPPWTFEVSQP